MVESASLPEGMEMSMEGSVSQRRRQARQSAEVRTASRRSRRARTSSRISWGRESRASVSTAPTGMAEELGIWRFLRGRRGAISSAMYGAARRSVWTVEDLGLCGLLLEMGLAFRGVTKERGSCSPVAGYGDKMARNKKFCICARNTCRPVGGKKSQSFLGSRFVLERYLYVTKVAWSIPQYLSNINKNATVLILQKI